MALLDAWRRRLPSGDATVTPPARPLPDPSRPPANRGSWEEAALANVEVAEFVKRQLGTVTPPWKK